MLFSEFSKANRARCESPDGFGHALDSWSLSDWFLAFNGEAGEAANVAKKLNRVRDGIKGNKESEAELRARLRREVGDTFVYLDLLAQAAGFTIEEAAVEAWDAKSEEIDYPVCLRSLPEEQAESIIDRHSRDGHLRDLAGIAMNIAQDRYGAGSSGAAFALATLLRFGPEAARDFVADLEHHEG